MPTPQQRLSGDDSATEQLWFAYFSAASMPLLALRPGWMRVAGKTGRSTRSSPDPRFLPPCAGIIFSALTLEYRMKRALEVLGVKLRKNTSFGDLVSCFWSRVGDSKFEEKRQVRRADRMGSAHAKIDLAGKVAQRRRARTLCGFEAVTGHSTIRDCQGRLQ